MFTDVISFFMGLKVEEAKPGVTRVMGIKTAPFIDALRKKWGTSKIGGNMFRKLTLNYFEIDDFFLPDLVYVSQQILKDRRIRINRTMIEQMIDKIYEHTWMKSTLNKEPSGRLDYKNLARLKWAPLPHQELFFQKYDLDVSNYRLNGYLLGAKAGSGKTFCSIAISEMLDTDITIVVVPKRAIVDPWVNTLSTLFVETPKFWHSGSGTSPLPNMRYYVVHYEMLSVMSSFIQKIGKGRRINIILDESHNFNDLSSLRTEIFVEMCRSINCQNVLWMSGTPIKAMGSEVIPMLRSFDPMFTEKVQERFKNIYGLSSSRALDILANRIGFITYTVEGDVIKNEVFKYRVDVTMPDSEKFTLNSVKEAMRKFIVERTDYYKKHMKEYIRDYFDALAEYEQTLTPADIPEFKQYKLTAKILHEMYDPMMHKQEPIFCNLYEKRKIIPALSRETRISFMDARSVYKYVNLKIQGEALGRILGRLRTECNVRMVEAWQNYTATDLQTNEKFETNLIDIVDQSTKKTILFTSYVEVVDRAAEIFTEAGGKPAKIYGETNNNLPAIIKDFATNPKTNPLCATLQSLSTAVPLVMANTVVFLNAPFRIHEYEQAQARVNRLGQTEAVHLFDVYLDTGKEPNISTRSSDIMAWSKEQVDAIMGTSTSSSAGLEDIREDFVRTGVMPAMEEIFLEYKRSQS